MPGAEALGGLLFLLGRVEFATVEFGGKSDAVKVFQFWLQPKSIDQSKAEDAQEQTQSGPLQGLAKVEPFGDLVEQGDGRADVLQHEITFQKGLRYEAGEGQPGRSLAEQIFDGL